MKEEIISIVNNSGKKEEANVVTYLLSEEDGKKYLVYTKNEVQGIEMDKVIYISRLEINDNEKILYEIEDNAEWERVQKLLKEIANN